MRVVAMVAMVTKGLITAMERPAESGPPPWPRPRPAVVTLRPPRHAGPCAPSRLPARVFGSDGRLRLPRDAALDYG
jgi:hypothetical protein